MATGLNISLDYVVATFPQLATQGGKQRTADLLKAAQEFKLSDAKTTAIFPGGGVLRELRPKRPDQ